MITNDPHGYVGLGLFLFGLCLFAISAGVALVAWALTSAPILLGLAVVIVIVGVGFIVSNLRGRN